MIGPYDTPYAFRSALEARLRNIAQSHGTDLQRLQRRVAFERLLARLFALDEPPWLLKGGYALELRFEYEARSTLDVDLSVPRLDDLRLLSGADESVSSASAVYEHLQQAAERDLGDGFRFVIGHMRRERTGAPLGGIRCSVQARLAGRIFAQFRLDVGLGDAVLGQPDWIKGGDLLAFAGIPPVDVALYPVAQQFSEKAHAYTFPWEGRENTRVKDLVDLVLLAKSGLLDPERVRLALKATFQARQSHPLPARLSRPPSAWVEPYEALARELGLRPRTIEEAYAYLNAYWQELELSQGNDTGT